MWSILTIFGSLHIHSIHCWEVTGSLTHKACLLRLRYRDLLASAVLRAGGETLTLQWRARQQLVTAGLTLHAEYCHGGVPTCSDSLPGSPQYSYSLPRRDANLGFQCRPTVLWPQDHAPPLDKLSIKQRSREREKNIRIPEPELLKFPAALPITSENKDKLSIKQH